MACVFQWCAQEWVAAYIGHATAHMSVEVLQCCTHAAACTTAPVRKQQEQPWQLLSFTLTSLGYAKAPPRGTLLHVQLLTPLCVVLLGFAALLFLLVAEDTAAAMPAKMLADARSPSTVKSRLFIEKILCTMYNTASWARCALAFTVSLASSAAVTPTRMLHSKGRTVDAVFHPITSFNHSFEHRPGS
jgi:hypothetical protein